MDEKSKKEIDKILSRLSKVDPMGEREAEPLDMYKGMAPEMPKTPSFKPETRQSMAGQGKVQGNPMELLTAPSGVKYNTERTFFDTTELPIQEQARIGQQNRMDIGYGVKSGESDAAARRRTVEELYGPLDDNAYADLIMKSNPELNEDQLRSILMQHAPNADILNQSSGKMSPVEELRLEMMLQDIWGR